MKIRIVQDHLRNGGTERQTLLMGHAFRAAGHDAGVVLFRPGGALAPRLAGLPHRVLQPFDTRQNWFAPGLAGALRADDPDVVMCMGAMANCHAGLLRARLPRSFVCGTLRGSKPLPWLIRRSLTELDHIVANSLETAEYLRDEYGVRDERVSVIHNALVFPPAADLARNDDLRARLGAGPGTVVMLCVGMFRPEKNQRALVDLAAALPRELDWQLWFGGEGVTRAACEEQARRLGLAERVRFLGFQADPSPLYRAADVAVLASKAESLSNFLIEAQAHGLPAVVAEVRGARECLLPGVSGEITPAGDLAAHRAALLPYLRDRALRERAGRAAAAFAREAFDPARQARAYLDLFERVLAAKAA